MHLTNNADRILDRKAFKLTDMIPRMTAEPIHITCITLIQ